MLPALRNDRMSLADVMPACLGSVADGTGPFAASGVRKAIVVVVDGLGAISLKAHAGHARTLAAPLDRASTIDSGFPTTTSAALASLTTGVQAGVHGMVGYTVRDPETDTVVNLLNEWQHIDPATWQRHPTVFEQAADVAVHSFAIGPARFRGSSYTRAVLRGAEYRGAETIAERFAAARTAMDAAQRAIAYVYIPELDKAGHSSGVDSGAWVTTLEAIDAEIRAFVATLRRGEGVIVTADHGMVDIAHEAHVLFGAVGDDPRIDGVHAVAGEPRCLQLHCAPQVDAREVAARWQTAEGDRAWVATRDEVVSAGWFGEVDPAVLDRLGDVFVAARRSVAYYDARSESSLRGRRMIGQHGSMTPDEVRVPLLRFGGFSD